MEDKSIIGELVEASNKATFFPKGIRVDLLKNCPQVIPTLAEWKYNEWSKYDKTLIREKLIKGLQRGLNKDKIPFVLIALRNEKLIGAIALKEGGESEFGDLSKQGPWLGSLHVFPEERNAGLGGELLKIVKSIAYRLGHKSLLVYTSQTENVPWYQKRGAIILKKVFFRGHQVTLMQMTLN